MGDVWIWSRGRRAIAAEGLNFALSAVGNLLTKTERKLFDIAGNGTRLLPRDLLSRLLNIRQKKYAN
jgi:hypothetical protein